MEERSQPFRLPWLAPQRSTVNQPQRPLRSTTSIPIRRPSDRPDPSKTSTPSPANTQPSPPSSTTEPEKNTSQSSSSQTTTTNKPPSPSLVTIETTEHDSQSTTSSESVAISKSPSRSVEDSPETADLAPAKSPSQGRPQSKVGSATPSPSRGDPKSKASSSPSSPSRSASQRATTPGVSTPRRAARKEAETTVDTASQTLSSPTKPQNQGSSEPPPASSQPQVSSQEPAMEVEIKSEVTKKPTSQDEAILADRTEELNAESTPSQRPNSSVVLRDQKLIEGESTGTVQESLKEEQSNKADYEETRHKGIVETPSSGNNNTVEFQPPKNQQKRGNFSETSSTISYIGNQIKTVSPSQQVQGSTTRRSFRNSDDEESPRQREIKEDISKLVRKLTTGPELDDKQVVVITLAGENNGASMVLSSEQSKKEASIHIHRGYKSDPKDSPESTTDGESTTKGKRLDDKPTPSAVAYANSNVQSINNSIVVQASVHGRNPGIHLVFSQKASNAVEANDKSKLIETRKAEFTSTRAERLTHEPIVRRRCLRGLFLESSDSEPDNPDKPRRHGCRYSCGEKSRDKEFM